MAILKFLKKNRFHGISGKCAFSAKDGKLISRKMTQAWNHEIGWSLHWTLPPVASQSGRALKYRRVDLQITSYTTSHRTRSFLTTYALYCRHHTSLRCANAAICHGRVKQRAGRPLASTLEILSICFMQHGAHVVATNVSTNHYERHPKNRKYITYVALSS